MPVYVQGVLYSLTKPSNLLISQELQDLGHQTYLPNLLPDQLERTVSGHVIEGFGIPCVVLHSVVSLFQHKSIIYLVEEIDEFVHYI